MLFSSLGTCWTCSLTSSCLPCYSCPCPAFCCSHSIFNSSRIILVYLFIPLTSCVGSLFLQIPSSPPAFSSLVRLSPSSGLKFARAHFLPSSLALFLFAFFSSLLSYTHSLACSLAHSASSCHHNFPWSFFFIAVGEGWVFPSSRHYPNLSGVLSRVLAHPPSIHSYSITTFSRLFSLSSSVFFSPLRLLLLLKKDSLVWRLAHGPRDS